MEHLEPQSTPATPPGDPRAAFAELSRIQLGTQPLSGVLGQVAELAKQTIPGIAEASVTLMQGKAVSTVVFTGRLAIDLDERQYETGFGPCLAAAATGAMIAIPDTAADRDFPDFARAASRRGVTAVLAIGLPLERRTVGALNLYGAGAPFDEATLELARGFADYAAVAVANAGVYASSQQLAHNLQRALESRALIDQAKGILMARHRVSPEAAFALLAERSQRANRKVRDMARDLVDEVQRPES